MWFLDILHWFIEAQFIKLYFVHFNLVISSACSINKFIWNIPTTKIHLQRNNTTVKYDNTYRLFQQCITVSIHTQQEISSFSNNLLHKCWVQFQPLFIYLHNKLHCFWDLYDINSWHALDACGIVVQPGLIFPSFVIHAHSLQPTCCIFESREPYAKYGTTC